MKRGLAVLAALILTVQLCSCAAPERPEGVTVVATLFPQYDFARAIAGDLATVTLLIDPGVESHSYEPSPADIVSISEATLFVYTGEYMEPWAAELANGLENAVDCSCGMTLDEVEHHGEEAHEHEHEHGNYDPHIWTDPTMASVMVENIAAALIAADPENAGAYRENADAYKAELMRLDADIAQAVTGFSSTAVCFSGRFAMHYFAKRYGLSVISAYDSCSSETEPSAQAVAEIIDRVNEDGVRAVYYEELIDPKLARSIANQTGCDTYLLHSCHNLSRAEFLAGESYISLMYQNLENLIKGLG